MKIINILLVSLLTISCGGAKTTEDGPVTVADVNEITLTDAQVKNAGISTSKIEQRTLSTILKVNGMVDVPPQNMMSVSAPMGGYLKYSKLLPGMHIRKGEVLAVMEDQQYIQLQQDYLTAKARISYLENEYNRQRDLNKNKAASDKVYQQAEAEYNSHRVLIAALGEKLKLAGINTATLDENNISRSIRIYSPIDGYVSAVNVNMGKYITPTEVMFELINPTDIHLALTIFEKDLDKLFIGQKLLAYTNNNPTKKYSCEVLLISKDLSPERVASVHCHFISYDKILVPGTYMNADIEVKNNNASVLPEEALVRYQNGYYAFIKKGTNKFEMTPIETGTTHDGYTEVKASPEIISSEFVTKGAYAVLMSLKNKAED